jgi:large conductance mechanosensitive channel
MKAFFDEFKNFAMRGNVIDMAVGVVIGAAFGKIVSSMVSNIIMPPLGLVLGGVDFTNFFINLGTTPVKTLQEAQAANVPVIAYGAFLNTVIEFLIIAFAIFLIVKQINRFMPKPEPAPEPRLCPYCKQPIADDATRCPHCTSMLDTPEDKK